LIHFYKRPQWVEATTPTTRATDVQKRRKAKGQNPDLEPERENAPSPDLDRATEDQGHEIEDLDHVTENRATEDHGIEGQDREIEGQDRGIGDQNRGIEDQNHERKEKAKNPGSGRPREVGVTVALSPAPVPFLLPISPGAQLPTPRRRRST